MTTAFPLTWPAGWPRTRHPRASRFDTSRHRAQNMIINELERLGAKSIVISTNLELRRDGLPYTKQTHLDDQGVAVYFMLNGNEQCMPCDRWASIAENMQAIAKSIEALRGLDRWGAREMVDAAFRGFKALPVGAIVPPRVQRPWHEVLEVSPTASPDVIRAAWKQLVLKYHPDNKNTGDEQNFTEVQDAYRQSGNRDPR